MIASTYPYERVIPVGSHPLTDPLFSSSHLRIIHDGASVSRIAKIEQIAQSDVAMRYLRVCFRSISGGNCGTCGKCYRTLSTLVALGALDRCATFKSSEFRLENAARIHYEHGLDAADAEDIAKLALRTGHRELALRLRQSFKFSSRVDRQLAVAHWLQRQRVIWRFGRVLEQRALSGALR